MSSPPSEREEIEEEDNLKSDNNNHSNPMSQENHQETEKCHNMPDFMAPVTSEASDLAKINKCKDEQEEEEDHEIDMVS